MVDGTLSEKLRQILDYANGDLPEGNAHDVTRQRRLVQALERLAPAFWDLDSDILAQIVELESLRLTNRIMEANQQALGLEIRRQKPLYRTLYQDPEYLDQFRIRNTPFEDLIEQGHPGFLSHVLDFVDRLQHLGLHSEYETKRRTDSIQTLHAGIMVRRLADDENTPILSLSGSGKIICRSGQTGSLKPFLISHVIALSRDFGSPLSYDHEEWLLTSEEMQNIVRGGGYANLEDALARRPDFAPFVSVDIGIVLPDRADHWISLVERLLHTIEQNIAKTKRSRLSVTRLTKASGSYFKE